MGPPRSAKRFKVSMMSSNLTLEFFQILCFLQNFAHPSSVWYFAFNWRSVFAYMPHTDLRCCHLSSHYTTPGALSFSWRCKTPWESILRGRSSATTVSLRAESTLRGEAYVMSNGLDYTKTTNAIIFIDRHLACPSCCFRFAKKGFPFFQVARHGKPGLFRPRTSPLGAAVAHLSVALPQDRRSRSPRVPTVRNTLHIVGTCFYICRYCRVLYFLPAKVWLIRTCIFFVRDTGFILMDRFVMTKIHSLSFGSKLDGAVDAAISTRLQALQFLTPQDLNVSEYARNDTVLALAQVR